MITLESEDGNKGTLHQKRVRQRGKSLTDTHTTIHSLSETLQTTTLPSSTLYLISSTHTLHMVTMDIYLHIPNVIHSCIISYKFWEFCQEVVGVYKSINLTHSNSFCVCDVAMNTDMQCLIVPGS